MISRQLKVIFYVAASPFIKISGVLYRLFGAPKGHDLKTVRVHLGPGQKNYITNWINVDANIFTAKCDVWADLRHRLPFRDATVDAVYSHHVIEHLPDIEDHMRDVRRILKPGGVYRVAGPNGDAAVTMFMKGRTDWFSDWPDRFESIGGRFVNFVFCRNEHLSMLSESFIRELAMRAGFNEIHKGLPMINTTRSDLFTDALKYEHETDFENPHTIVLELIK